MTELNAILNDVAGLLTLSDDTSRRFGAMARHRTDVLDPAAESLVISKDSNAVLAVRASIGQ